MSRCSAHLRAHRTEGPILPGGWGGARMTAGLPAHYCKKSSTLPNGTPFPHRLGAVSAYLPPEGTPPTSDLGSYSPFPLPLSYRRPGIQGGSSGAEAHVEGRVPVSLQAKQQLLPEARAEPLSHSRAGWP